MRSFAAIAIVLGVTMALFFGLAMAAVFAATERSLWLLRGLMSGFLFGSIMGPMMAYLLRSETATIAFTDKNAFVTEVNAALTPLGYQLATHGEDFLKYRFTKGLAPALIPGVSVQVRAGQSMIVGPKIFVRKLLKRLRAPLSRSTAFAGEGPPQKGL